VQDGRGVHNFSRRGIIRRGRLHHDLHFIFEVGIADFDVDHETIKLSFGQRVCSFLLDGILRGQDKERQRQRERAPSGSNFVLLHGLQKRRLSFRRRTVDFVGQQNIREDRALEKLKAPSAGARIFLQDVRSRDVRRHQIGRELNPIEFEVQDFREGADQKRFRQSGNADQQTMALGEQGDQNFLDDVILADNDFADFAKHAVALGSELFDFGDLVLLDLG
jgi:hypothetical protein